MRLGIDCDTEAVLRAGGTGQIHADEPFRRDVFQRSRQLDRLGVDFRDVIGLAAREAADADAVPRVVDHGLPVDETVAVAEIDRLSGAADGR